MLRLLFVLILLSPAAHAVEEKDKHFTQTLYLQPYSNLKHAAELGDVDAQFDLAYLYYKADSDPSINGMTQSNNLAAHWYRKAAQQGHLSAQYNMAVLYLHGHGVDRDPVAAYAWLLLAADEGHKGSQELIKELDTILNEEQIQDAHQRSKELGVSGSAS
jgi:TPR repeat protein